MWAESPDLTVFRQHSIASKTEDPAWCNGDLDGQMKPFAMWSLSQSFIHFSSAGEELYPASGVLHQEQG